MGELTAKVASATGASTGIGSRPSQPRPRPPAAGAVGPPRSVALVGTYPPTRCGLATFASNLRDAVVAPQYGWEASIVRVLDEPEPERSPEVAEHWLTGDRGSLRSVLDVLDRVDAVLLQHEYGLFGGVDGEDVVGLVESFTSPLVAVLHTVLDEPTPHQHRVLDRVLDSAAAVVVQSRVARQRILAVHDIVPERVVVIPHGAAANFHGPILDHVRQPAVLTWGLLSPGKGIEQGIEAIARLRSDSKAPSYVVAGQTHPKVRAAHGESYRDALRSLARSLGLGDRVCFDDSYRDWDSLRALVRSAEVVLLPYESRDQVSSGVLVEAIASGKPVVATRFPHAEELLTGGAGLVVDHGDVQAMAEALNRVLYEPGLADQMAAAARRTAEPLLWPAVGAEYRALINRVIEARAVA
jgi:polysaccharide biosynthesis protein PslF